MPKIFKCLQCGIEFPIPSGKGEMKFHDMTCYKAFRTEHGTEKVRTTPAIFVKETPSRSRGRSKREEPVAINPPVDDPVKTKEEPVQENIIEQNDDMSFTEESINFDDLSVSQIKLILNDLLIEREKFIYEIDLLKIQIEEYQHTPQTLPELVEKFCQDVAVLQNKLVPSSPPTPSSPVKELPVFLPPKDGELVCYGCGHPFIPKHEDQAFCSDTCAKEVLPKFGVMKMSDGRMIRK